MGIERPDLITTPPRIERLSLQDNNYFKYAMACNGYVLQAQSRRGWEWTFKPVQHLAEEFRGTKQSPKGPSVSLFGPNAIDTFFEPRPVDPTVFVRALRQVDVIDVIKDNEFYSYNGGNLAERLSYIFGGLVRHLNYKNAPIERVEEAVRFTAKMVKLGERESAEAIAMAVAMYIMSGGSIKEDPNFMGRIYKMAEAVSADTTNPVDTKDLGLSQVARLRGYSERVSGLATTALPDNKDYLKPFRGFPTVGAEFHCFLTISRQIALFGKE